jgi:hypothetical protein
MIGLLNVGISTLISYVNLTSTACRRTPGTLCVHDPLRCRRACTACATPNSTTDPCSQSGVIACSGVREANDRRCAGEDEVWKGERKGAIKRWKPAQTMVEGPACHDVCKFTIHRAHSGPKSVNHRRMRHADSESVTARLRSGPAHRNRRGETDISFRGRTYA